MTKSAYLSGARSEFFTLSRTRERLEHTLGKWEVHIETLRGNRVLIKQRTKLPKNALSNLKNNEKQVAQFYLSFYGYR